MNFESVIGLEIHAQLLTETKIFCGCSVTFGAPPNSHVCPTCLGLPGALPVLNRRAVEYAVRAALALGCAVQPTSIFARKNYFYPDLPKGYQISQYEQPLATDGRVDYVTRGRKRSVGIIRVHLEEDAGKSLHEGFADSDRKTYLDFNRSGVPLLEIVTRPDLRSGADAADFFERLRDTLRALGVNDGNMEEGSLRCDANVSVRPVGDTRLGVKVEVKNINSFRFLQRALDYEHARQVALVTSGRPVLQETRLWNAGAGRTESMRTKEEAHDYRYFPEPDLPPLEISAPWVADILASLPELPEARKERFMVEYGLTEQDALLLTASTGLADYYEATARAGGNPKATANWIMGELSRKMNELGIDVSAVRVTPEALGGLIRLIDQAVISGSTAKDVFERMYESGRPADEIVRSEGLAQIDDEATLARLVEETVGRHPDAVASYRSGKSGSLGFLVGQVMRASGGKANPKRVNELMRRALDQEPGARSQDPGETPPVKS